MYFNVLKLSRHMLRTEGQKYFNAIFIVNLLTKAL